MSDIHPKMNNYLSSSAWREAGRGKVTARAVECGKNTYARSFPMQRYKVFCKYANENEKMGIFSYEKSFFLENFIVELVLLKKKYYLCNAFCNVTNYSLI